MYENSNIHMCTILVKFLGTKECFSIYLFINLKFLIDFCPAKQGTYVAAKIFVAMYKKGLVLNKDLRNRALACDITSVAFNRNVWQKRVAFVLWQVKMSCNRTFCPWC